MVYVKVRSSFSSFYFLPVHLQYRYKCIFDAMLLFFSFSFPLGPTECSSARCVCCVEKQYKEKAHHPHCSLAGGVPLHARLYRPSAALLQDHIGHTASPIQVCLHMHACKLVMTVQVNGVCIRKIKSLLFACRKLVLDRCEEMCYLNKLLMVSVLGWLFQVSYNVQARFVFYVMVYTVSSRLTNHESKIYLTLL